MEPRSGEGDLVVAADFDAAEAAVRRGIDSARLVIAAEAERDAALAAARRGRARGLGPAPPVPHSFGWRSLVVLPTYNEIANLAELVEQIFTYLDTDVLVVDDGSPDGTGQLADRLAAANARLAVLHRAGKQGLGTAYLAGFAHALAHGYQRVFEMDADFSHPPWDLPRLAAASRQADLVIGSRYVPGGSSEGWEFRRRVLSRSANVYARTLLRLPIADCTAGFRCYDTAVLARLDLSRVAATGYSFQIEMLYRVIKAGYRVVELPIHFVDRAAGASKMNGVIAWEALRLVPGLPGKVRRYGLLRDDARRT